mmetsp:Transcript_17599/g.27174  ORF Transcript_17599/g.27174 Transcript_17599/m.27174 type:complete len:214 (+) Transcript_17599:685-1326(+)
MITGIRICCESVSSMSYFFSAMPVIIAVFDAVPVTWNSASFSESCRAEVDSPAVIMRFSLLLISFSAISSDATQMRGSPAFGNDSKPSTLTGWDGMPILRVLSFTSFKTLILPVLRPLTTTSPRDMDPHRTMQSATTPRPFSILASITIPSPRAFSSALKSIISLWSTKPSIKSSRPSPVIPETRNSCTGGPYSGSSEVPAAMFSVIIPCSSN